jgi:ATP-dependent protease ClpP protease subunit
MKIAQQRIGLSGFTFSLFCALFVSFPCVQAQAPAVAPTTPPAFQIHFFAQVDYNSINQLIGMIDQQMRMGTKDFYILLSSPGGDPSAGLAAYTYLHGLPVNITTFNLGDVDSAANLIFCAGKQRYAMPGTRFLIHGASYNAPPGTQLDSAGLDAQLAQIKNLNDMMENVINSATKDRKSDIDAAIHSQKILGRVIKLAR